MAIQQKLHTKLVQKLILTPSLQQAIKLLPMSTLELADLLNQEMVENPLLEEVPTEDLQPAEQTQEKAQTEEKPQTDSFEKLGLEVADLTGELRKQLELDDAAKGVVVRKVKAGSPASRAGLAPGDVIEKVGDTSLASVDDFKQALESESLEDGVLLMVSNRGGRYLIVLKSR